MNGLKKEGFKRDMCKSHSARSDRELYRVCPSKLSKKELEDLYFTLLENNLELKRTVTGQQEQIKVLSTRVQRMTAANKNNVAKEKDCCTYTKSMVNEQKESIADLKRANERLSERIRVLNMRLCSAKQFLRRSPATSVSRCTKCSAPPASLKNSSVSVLNARISDSNVKTAVSTRFVDKDPLLSTRTVETETEEPEKENPETLCNENRCRSLMEELKQKIVDLQEELSKTHNEYSTRIGRLEDEVSELRAANDRERTQRAASDHELKARAQQAEQLASRLRDAEAKCGEVSTELSIEKRKVAELETRVRAADRAAAVSKTLQDHLNSSSQMKNEIENEETEPRGSPFYTPRWESSPRLEVPQLEVPQLEVPSETAGQPSEATDKPSDKDQSTEKADQHRLSKLSNDSGYIDAYKNPVAADQKVFICFS
ncbi:putative leucine-rich repeat-containing protein DDB_G0290503 [Ostrinia nubilalis]|uniref:putative leucine-rich repeat-containing protein DDB_G0290503 n=1 Tax=Ostrinia nubilalis TaxID=29057 RepID=UPI003082391A